MTGLHDTDIRLSDDWALTRAADGDAPLCSGLDCLYQNIVMEAETQPGDLFYDLEWGWGLYDFIQSEDDELILLEMEHRVRIKLQKRESILPETINVNVYNDGDVFHIDCTFQFTEEDQARQLNVIVGAVDVEVIIT